MQPISVTIIKGNQNGLLGTKVSRTALYYFLNMVTRIFFGISSIWHMTELLPNGKPVISLFDFYFSLFILKLWKLFLAASSV